MEDTLWHINWGDNDNCFVIAPDEETARAKIAKGKERISGDMVNYVVEHDSLYQRIFKAGEQQGIEKGRKEVVEKLLTNELLEVGRKAIEDVLVEWRNNRISEFNSGNGLVIRERDGRDSSIIRFRPDTALRIGIQAMWQAFLKGIDKEE